MATRTNDTAVGGRDPFLDLIAHAEGTSEADGYRGYNETLDYGRWTGGDVDLVNMTLGEVKALQQKMLSYPENRARYGSGSARGSSALGRYQIVGRTLRSVQSALGLSDDTKFTPAVQDRMAMHLLNGRGYADWKSGKISDDRFLNNVAGEWASFPNAAGRGGRITTSEVLAMKDAQPQPQWAQNVDNSNPVRVAYQPETDAPRPNPQMTPRLLDVNPASPLPAAPTSPVDVASLPPLAMPMPPSQAALAPPSYQVASLAPDMPASMAPWNRTTATEVMPTVPKPASWNTSFPPQTNRQAQQDIISQMSPDWQQRAAQLGLGTAPPRTTPNVQIANVDPMVNQAADIYRQTMGAPMPGYLDAARESATYRPANMPAYTPARMVPDSVPRMVPDSTPSSPTIWNQTPSAFPKANMVPDTPARMVSDTPARQTAWDAPVPPSPFDQVAASIAQPSVAAPARVSAPPAPPMPDTDLTPWQNWSTGGADIVPARGGFDNAPYNPAAVVPSMPAPISTPTPATRTVTEQVLNPEWQKWMDLQTAYPEADGIFGALPLGPDTYLRTSRAEPNKYIVKNNQVVERQPVPPMPNTQLPFPNGVPPTRSPVQQFFHTVLDGAHSLGSGNIGAMGGLFGNMVWRNTLSVPEQARLMQAGVNPTYGGYTPTAFHSALTKPSASGGPNYDYTTGTDASGNFKSTYTADNGNTYGISSWSDSFSAPPNSTMYEVSWS